MSIDNFEPRVTQLVIYPVKGLAGQPCETVEVLHRGFAWDRRWMLVGEDRTFLSQRQLPGMATIQARIVGEELVLLHSSSQSKIAVPIQQPDTAPKMPVTIWKDQVEALCVPNVGQWLSEILDYGCRLVFMPDTTRRQVNPAFARPGEIVSFADAYPILLVGGASISDLNARLTEPVPVDRFRPNIVVSSQEPFEEDTWGELEIGSALLCGAKASDRCSVPTINQRTGERTGPEPIRTLSGFRRFGTGVFLGQNLTVRRPGRLAVNDRVRIRGRMSAVYA
jgi:uncharacterized protein